MKKHILKIHLIVLVFIFLNFLLKKTLGVSLIIQIDFFLKTLLVITGLILSFGYFKSFKKKLIYFTIYPISILLLVVGFIVHGIFFGLVTSIILFPVYPDNIEYEKENIIIYTEFQGLLGACCNYKVSERYLLIFQIIYEDSFSAESGAIDFENIKVEKVNDIIELTYSGEFYNPIKDKFIEKDTTLMLTR